MVLDLKNGTASLMIIETNDRDEEGLGGEASIRNHLGQTSNVRNSFGVGASYAEGLLSSSNNQTFAEIAAGEATQQNTTDEGEDFDGVSSFGD